MIPHLQTSGFLFFNQITAEHYLRAASGPYVHHCNHTEISRFTLALGVSPPLHTPARCRCALQSKRHCLPDTTSAATKTSKRQELRRASTSSECPGVERRDPLCLLSGAADTEKPPGKRETVLTGMEKFKSGIEKIEKLYSGSLNVITRTFT